MRSSDAARPGQDHGRFFCPSQQVENVKNVKGLVTNMRLAPANFPAAGLNRQNELLCRGADSGLLRVRLAQPVQAVSGPRPEVLVRPVQLPRAAPPTAVRSATVRPLKRQTATSVGLGSHVHSTLPKCARMRAPAQPGLMPQHKTRLHPPSNDAGVYTPSERQRRATQPPPHSGVESTIPLRRKSHSPHGSSCANHGPRPPPPSGPLPDTLGSSFCPSGTSLQRATAPGPPLVLDLEVDAPPHPTQAGLYEAPHHPPRATTAPSEPAAPSATTMVATAFPAPQKRRAVDVVAERRTKRRAAILPRGSVFASEELRQEARKDAIAKALADRLPYVLRYRLLGGANGELQVPDPGDREAILARILRNIGGPQGDALLNAERALEVLQAHAEISGLPELCLPVSSILAHQLINDEHKRALERGKGAQGGATAGEALRAAFVWLRQHLNLEIHLDEAVVAAAAPGQGKRTSWRAAAGTLTLAAHCQLEYIAASTDPSILLPLRTIARSLLAFGWDHCVRVQDMARAKPLLDSLQPDTVMHGWTSYSKDGKPLLFYAPAVGVLGPYTWYPEHRKQVLSLDRTFPMWETVWGSKKLLLKSKAFHPVAQATKDQIRAALKEILTLPPLSLTETELADLKITGHSCHGSFSDWARAIGPNPTPYFLHAVEEAFAGFTDPDANALGHWLRDANAPPPPEANQPRPGRGRGGGGTNSGRGVGAGRRPAQAPGAPATGNEMVYVYTTGEERVGERETQLRIRSRLMAWAGRSLAFWCETHQTTWHELPRGRVDLQILTQPPQLVQPHNAPAPA